MTQANECSVAESVEKASHPCPIDADLWILGGQSNMQGYGIQLVKEATDPRIMIFSMDNHWMIAEEPIHRLYEAAAPVHRAINIAMGHKPEDLDRLAEESKKKPVGGVGPGLYFAQRVLEVSGRPIGLIPCAHGGTSMNQWSPDLKAEGDDSLYGAMLNRIQRVGGKVKGVLWYQGESDTDPGSCDAYKGKMINFIDSLRRDTDNPDLPILIVQLGRYMQMGQPAEKELGFQKVRESQRLLVRERKNVFMVPAVDLSLDDPIHISQEGQKVLGQRLAETALSQVYKIPGRATPIDLVSLKIENPESNTPVIHLRFSGVSGRLRSEGRPVDFTLVSKGSTSWPGSPAAYRTEFDPGDPAGLIVRIGGELTPDIQLLYGLGSMPYVNIVDEKNMAVPAFGPLDLK